MYQNSAMSIGRPIILLILMTVTAQCLAAAIKLSSFNSYERNEHFLVDATFELDFSDEVLEALKHGIPIQVHVDCEVRTSRKWVPDKTINALEYSYQLLHQPLTEDYLTVNLKTGLRQSYDNLSAALVQIGHLENISLINKKSLAEDEVYKGRIRMYLDLDSLPTPMRPQVYFMKNWDISSDWHEWVIKE